MDSPFNAPTSDPFGILNDNILKCGRRLTYGTLLQRAYQK